MSGGSMDYFYGKLGDAVDQVQGNTMRRIAIRSHMVKLARALKAIEWNDSGDGDDQEDALIDDCLAPRDVLAVTLSEAERIMEELKIQIEKARK